MLKENYTTYKESLMKLNLDSLSQRRQILCLKFAKAGLKHKNKENDMHIRQSEKYQVNFPNTERL